MGNNEIALLVLFGLASAAAIVGPSLRLLWTLRKDAFPRAVVIKDQNGAVIGTLSAESVQQTDNENDLVRLHERVRRSEHVSVEAA